jgi:hypothetical protein
MDKPFVLRVNGQDIRANAFVQKALRGMLSGFVSALADVPGPLETIDVHLVLKPRKETDK